MQRVLQLSYSISAIMGGNVIRILGEISLSLVALLITAIELVCRGILLLVRKTAALLVQLFYTAALAAVFVLTFCILMGIYLAMGPGFHANLP